MKRFHIILGLCLLVVAMLGAVAVGFRQVQGKKRQVTAELVERLRSVGVSSRVEIYKSKLDADDLKFKLWFHVPEDSRIIDVFWCEGAFQYEVRTPDGKHETIAAEKLEEFMRSNQPMSRTTGNAFGSTAQAGVNRLSGTSALSRL